MACQYSVMPDLYVLRPHCTHAPRNLVYDDLVLYARSTFLPQKDGFYSPESLRLSFLIDLIVILMAWVRYCTPITYYTKVDLHTKPCGSPHTLSRTSGGVLFVEISTNKWLSLSLNQDLYLLFSACWARVHAKAKPLAT